MNPSAEYRNPLLAPLLALLQQATTGYKVHELLAALGLQGCIPRLAQDDELQLFRVNFLIMNGLYQLQSELWPQGWWLTISSLDIRLQPATSQGTHSEGLARGAGLRSYYLDWQVFWQTDRAEVEALLASFWHRYQGGDHRAQALTLFELTADASPAAIRRRWRELALRHHPDRGGEAETFIRIRWAWECLKAHR